MNPFQAYFKSISFFVVTALLPLSGPGSNLLCAQSSSQHQPVIRDEFIQRADFQQQETSIPDPATSINDFAKETSNFSSTSKKPNWMSELKSQATAMDIPKVLGSLAIVLGGYFVFVWLTRQISGTGDGGLPREVVEVLGQTSFGPKKTLQLVRLGSKLLLLINSPDGTQSIGEITDPHEVEYLIGLCGGKRSRSAIAIRKASNTNRNNTSGNDLKRILMQLQQSTEPNQTNSVFEA